MIIEKAIRRRQLDAEPLGYREEGQEETTGWQDPIFDMAGPMVSETVLEEDASLGPKELKVRVRLLAEDSLATQDHTRVRYVQNGHAFKELAFYAAETSLQPQHVPYSAFREISLVLQKEECPGELECPFEDNVLYTKTFKTQQGMTLTQSDISAGDGTFISMPAKRPTLSGKHCHHLYAYGGYYKPGTPLDKIRQIYCRLTHSRDNSAIELLSKDTVQQRIARDGRAGPTYAFVDGELHPDSLAADIIEGKISVILRIGDERIEYRSIRFDHKDLHSAEIDLYFIPHI